MGGVGPENIGAFAIGIGLLLWAPLAAVVGLVLYVVLVAPVRNHPRLYVRRRFMCWLGPCGFLVGVVLPILIGWGDSFVAVMLASPVGGLMFGLASGNLVGRVVWFWLRTLDDEGRS